MCFGFLAVRHMGILAPWPCIARQSPNHVPLGKFHHPAVLNVVFHVAGRHWRSFILVYVVCHLIILDACMESAV